MRIRETPIALAAGSTAALLAALCLALAGTGEQGTVAGLRATAVFATPFLVGAYAAPALAVLWPAGLTEWLLPRRRALWLAFSAVLAVHLALILRLLSLPPEPPPTALGLAPGFLTYMVLAGLVLTSFHRIGRAPGTPSIQLLRRVGEHWIFAVFALALMKGIFIRHNALYVIPLAMVMAAYGVRFKAFLRSAPASPPSP